MLRSAAGCMASAFLAACTASSGFGLPPSDATTGDAGGDGSIVGLDIDLVGDVVPDAVQAASLRIDAGAPYTKSLDVTLELRCVNCTEVLIANDAACATGTYEAMAATRPWHLTQANAPNGVYARFKSAAGLETGCIAATILHDDIPPTAVDGMDDGTWTLSLNESPRMTWNGGAADTGSGLDRYELAVGTSPGTADFLSWRSNGLNRDNTTTGMGLHEGLRYYGSVRAVDRVGNVSPVTPGDGFVADVTPPALRIDWPNAGQILGVADVRIRGVCESGLEVTLMAVANLEELPSAACATGVFDLHAVKTGPGVCTFTATQTDPAGNVTTVSRSFSGPISPGPSRVDLFAGANTRWGYADGIGTAARLRAPDGIALDGDVLYLAEIESHILRRIDLTTRAVTTVAGKAGVATCVDGVGTAARLAGPTQLLLIGRELYITSQCHAVHVMDLATGQVTMIAGGNQGDSDGTGLAAEFNYPSGMATDGTWLYIVEEFGNRVRRMSLAGRTVTTVAGSTTSAGGYVNASGTAARFSQPTGILRIGTDLYIADTGNNAIRKVDASFAVTTWAGSSNGVGAHLDGVGTAARLNSPEGLATDGTTLFVAEADENDIRAIDLATATVTTVTGHANYGGLRDGPLDMALFDGPHKLLLYQGRLIVSDRDDHALRLIDLERGRVSTLVGNDSALADNWGLRNGQGADARMDAPGQAVVIGDTLYFVDTAASGVRAISLPDAVVFNVAGSGGIGALDGGPRTAQFSDPHGLATDSSSLFVVDRGNCTIRQVDLATADTTTLAGLAGNCGYVNATGAAARFDGPTAAAWLAGKLYVTDANNGAVRMLDLADNSVSTLAGSLPPVSWGYVEGIGTAARFGTLHGIVTDGTMLYVSDEGNDRIRSINPATGATALVAGSGNPGFVDGVGPAADLQGPEGLTWDGTRLYVAEPYNQAVRTVDPSTRQVTRLVGGGPDVATEVDGPLSTARLLVPSELVWSTAWGLFVSSGEQNWRWVH